MNWRIESESKKGVFYEVTLYDQGNWGCDCPYIPRKGGSRYCKHILGQQAAVVTGRIKLDNTPELDESFGVFTQPGAVKLGSDLLERAKTGEQQLIDKFEQFAKEASDKLTEPVLAPEDAAAPSGYNTRVRVEHEKAMLEQFAQANELNPVVEVNDIETAILAVYEQVAYVQKTWNQNLGYSFAGEAAIINNLRPALVKNGITFAVSKTRRRKVYHYLSKNGGPMTNVALEVRVTFTHALSRTKKHVWVWGEGADSGDKATPKALTGALKYALRQTFGLETGDDPDVTPSRDLERASGPSDRAVRQAQRDVLSRSGGRAPGDTPPWWQFFIKMRDDVGLKAPDVAEILLKPCTPINVSEYLDNLPAQPKTEEEINSALQTLLSRAADFKGKGGVPK